MNIKQYLKNLEIDFKVFNHPAVFTCEEAEKYDTEIRGIHCKNLFVKDKKLKIFYLVIIPANKKLDMNKLEFANKEDLKNILKLTAGAVSPFGLINDNKGIVKIMIDKAVWNSDFVSFHPNINTETLELKKEDFHKYIKSLKNELLII